MRTSSRLAGLAAAGAVLLSACGTVPADVAATVGDTEIPLSTLEARVRAQTASQTFQDAVPADQRVAETNNLQQQVLSQLVFQELITAAGEELGVEVTEEEIDEELEVQLSFFGSEEELQARLEELGLTEDDAREQLRAELLRRKIEERFTSDVQVSDDEIQALYDERAAQYETVTYGDIVLETEAEATEVAEALRGGADFAALARERSVDPGAAGNGGEVGARPVSQTDPDLISTLRAASPGDIVGPVQTADGLFHVMRLTSFDTLPLAEVRDSLRDEIAGQRSSGELQAFFRQFVADAEVSVNSRFGDWDPSTLTIVPPSPVGARGQGQ